MRVRISVSERLMADGEGAGGTGNDGVAMEEGAAAADDFGAS